MRLQGILFDEFVKFSEYMAKAGIKNKYELRLNSLTLRWDMTREPIGYDATGYYVFRDESTLGAIHQLESINYKIETNGQ